MPFSALLGFSQLSLVTGGLHRCSYLPERQARWSFVHPEQRMRIGLAQELMDQGYRRTGAYVYRPKCPGCEACISIRIPADEFRPNRSQRRCWQDNQERVSVVERPAIFVPEHYELFRRYTLSRHRDGEMVTADPREYLDFFTSPWADTRFVEFHRDGQLMAVAIVDILPRGLSAVYTFFDPELAAYSPGTYAILWQIEQAHRRALPWVYLGYWVAGCRKMSYKERFRPLEAWLGSGWVRFAKEPILRPEPG